MKIITRISLLLRGYKSVYSSPISKDDEYTFGTNDKHYYSFVPNYVYTSKEINKIRISKEVSNIISCFDCKVLFIEDNGSYQFSVYFKNKYDKESFMYNDKIERILNGSWA